MPGILVLLNPPGEPIVVPILGQRLHYRALPMILPDKRISWLVVDRFQIISDIYLIAGMRLRVLLILVMSLPSTYRLHKKSG